MNWIWAGFAALVAGLVAPLVIVRMMDKGRRHVDEYDWQ